MDRSRLPADLKILKRYYFTDVQAVTCVMMNRADKSAAWKNLISTVACHINNVDVMPLTKGTAKQFIVCFIF